jgi:hypothetical protein
MIEQHGPSPGRDQTEEDREQGGGKKPKDIEIRVNNKPVTVEEKELTGAQIKEAAVRDGVRIQLNFVLQQELANGSSKVIGDADPVRVHPKMSFTAIAPDDNS